MQDLKISIEINNIKELNQHVEKLQYLIKEVEKEIDLINKFKPDVKYS